MGAGSEKEAIRIYGHFKTQRNTKLPYTPACLASVLLRYAPMEDLEVLEDKLGSQLWELETLRIRGGDQVHHPSPVLQNFQSTLAKTGTRYEVALPWKFDPKESLQDNRYEALLRLNYLVRRPLKNMNLLARFYKT